MTIDSHGNVTRYITGMQGLAAIQTNSLTPTLQLPNLHGDIVATAALSETETHLLSTSDTTEFGVPRTTPSKYVWLGVSQRSTELASGIINMGARVYVPQIGRFEQTDPIEGGSANAYDYSAQDPVNNKDIGGAIYDTPYTPVLDSSGNEIAAAIAAQSVVVYQEAQAAVRARQAAEYAAEMASFEAEYALSAKEGPRVLWEKPGCTGMSACAASLFGFKVELGEVVQWWKKVKKGYELIKEVVEESLDQTIRANGTVCKAVGYGTAAGGYFVPEGRLARVLATAVGFGVTFAC
jgi:RHS repeat-associated protein